VQTKASFKKEILSFFRTGRFYIIAGVIIGLALFLPLLLAGMAAFIDAADEAGIYSDIGMDVGNMTGMITSYSSTGVTMSISGVAEIGLIVFLIFLNRAAGGEQKRRTIIIPKSSGLRGFGYLFPKYIIYPITGLLLGFLGMLASHGISILLFDTNDVLPLNIVMAGLLIGSNLALYICFHLTLGTSTGRSGLSAAICIVAAVLMPTALGTVGAEVIFNPFAMNLIAGQTILSGHLLGGQVLDIIFTLIFAKGIMVITFLVALFAQNARRIDNSGDDKEL